MAYAPDPAVDSLLVGHFRRDAGYRTVRPGGATSWLLIVTVEGQGWIGGPHGGEPFGPGDAALLAPGHPHAYHTAPESDLWDLCWAHFHPRPDWANLLSWPECRPGLRHCHLGPDASATVAALESARVHGERRTDAYEERLALAALESALIRVRRAAASAEAKGDPRLRAAIEYAMAHLRQSMSIEDLAAAVGLSSSRLAALFRAELGVSPRVFIERQRIERARRLLAMTDLTVRAIAEEVGFASEFYFSNRFRQVVGTSPTGYRQAQSSERTAS